MCVFKLCSRVQTQVVE